jgi:hypothetical protein
VVLVAALSELSLQKLCPPKVADGTATLQGGRYGDIVYQTLGSTVFSRQGKDQHYLFFSR